MATVKLDLFVNVTERKLVLSATNPATFTLAPRLFTVGDTVTVRFLLLERVSFSFGQNQLSQINPSGFAVKLGIGVEGSTTLTEATATSISGNYISMSLDLSTSEFSTAVNAGTAMFFYIKISESGTYQTVYSEAITGRKQITSITTTPAAGATYYSKDEVDALFAKLINTAGRTITLTSPDGTKQGILYVADDGSTHFDAVS